MKIRILGWKYINIRKFADVEINLEEGCRNTFIMMRNGTGKTTTMTLLRAVLSGAAEKWDAQKVRSFRPVNKAVQDGEFHLKVQYDTRIYYYILHLDYIEGKAYYETSCSGNRGGLEVGREVPSSFRGVMEQEEFVNRFLFDGEQAKKTLGDGNNEAEKAIVYLYQVNKMDELAGEIKRLVKSRQGASEKQIDRSIKIYRTKMEKGKQQYDKLLKERDSYKKEIKNCESTISELEKRYNEIIAQNDKLSREKDRVQEQERAEEERLRVIAADIMEQSKKPYNVSPVLDQRLKWLSENMQVLKLPKATAQEFFRELAESHTCICGREIGEKEKKIISKNAEKYLGQEQLGVLNTVKHKLKEYERCDIIYSRLDEMETCEENIRELYLELERIEIEVVNQGHTDIVDIKNRIQELKDKRAQYKERCERLETCDFKSYPYLDETNNIEKARKYWENAKENFWRETNTYVFARKAEKCIQYIEQIRERTLRNLKENIIQATNEKLEKLISNDQIQIEKIDGHIVLKDRKAASEGQTLAAAYAYIGSLFEHSKMEFPFVVDSPAVSMDLDVRCEVAEMLPGFFHQLIIFIISSEVSRFAETFYRLDNVRYITVEEKDGTIQLTEGRDYFSKFQVEEE